MRDHLKRGNFGAATEVAMNNIAYELKHVGEGSVWQTLENVASWLILDIHHIFVFQEAGEE